jgi:ABC-type bacteriocin/lantibiotic exporter with double-glycine peptidase domain
MRRAGRSSPRPTPRGLGLALGLALALTACQLPYTGGAHPVQPGSLGSGWYTAASTQVVRQHQESDCGLAALAMVASAWGRRWSVDDLDHQLPPGDKGVRLGDLRDLARARGLEAYAIRGTLDDLTHELSQGRPVLLGLLLPYDRSHNASHYEVAVAIHPDDGSVVTIDPASGQWRQRTRRVLELEWKPAGFATLVVVGDRQADGTHHEPAVAGNR